MERIGIFGGTFNPPHLGHIQAASQAVEALGLSQVLLVPDRVAPHKRLPEGSPTPQQRLEMLQAAVADRPWLQVSDIELRREGVSYTVETVSAIKQQYPHAELVLLLGTDMFLSVEHWKSAQKILKNVTLGVFCRGEKGEDAAIRAKKAELQRKGARVELVQNDAIPISSTQMRRLLAFQCVGGLLPPGVETYIRENHLYDIDAPWKNLPMEELERVVVKLLNPNRVAHVLGCRDTAVALAKRWGADPVDAARAGLLHDITKALDGPLQLTLCQAYGKMLDDFSRRYPKTLHALTGSLVAERIFGEKETVVSAICCHTTGKAAMNTLETILYVADYMEPNRDFPGVEKLRKLAYTDLQAALRLGLEMTLEHLKKQGSEVAPESREALAYLKNRNPKKG